MKNIYKIERSLYRQGFLAIAGVDEVGRGCIAGPVVAAAVIMPQNCRIRGVTDSKKLTDKKRRLLKTIIEEKALAVAVSFVDEKIIDQINILEASKLAMETSLQKLSLNPDYILVDALRLNLLTPQAPIIKGDTLSFSIACASIIAKVTRDDFMIGLDSSYPEYGFSKHKGYPTKFHLSALSNFGILEIHRKSYAPVKKYCK